MNAQDELARFIATAGRPWSTPEAIRAVLIALADTLAVSVAGRCEPVTCKVIDYLAPNAKQDGSAAWVSHQSFMPEDAALLNGVAAHALDYDDVAPAWRGHPSTVFFPALLACSAQERSLNVCDLVDAYAVGFEVGKLLGQAFANDQYSRGWHTTATIGIIGATAACARLLRLSQTQASAALSLAVAQAAGPQANFGTMAKPLHAGMAAASAVRATRLARLGVEASSSALDGLKGYARLYCNDIALGKITFNGPTLSPEQLQQKPYPNCFATHHATTALLRMRERQNLSADCISATDIEGSPGSHAALLKRSPINAMEAKFSLEYAIATALINGEVNLQSFSDDTFVRVKAANLMQRISLREADGTATRRYSCVRVTLNDGRCFEEICDSVPPLDEHRLISKITDCFAVAGVALCGDHLYSQIVDLADSPMTALEAVIQTIRPLPDAGPTRTQ